MKKSILLSLVRRRVANAEKSGIGRRAWFSSSHLGDALIFYCRIFHGNSVCLLFELDLALQRILLANTFLNHSCSIASFY